MTYGSILGSTRAYIEKRATQSSIPLEKLGLERCLDASPFHDNEYCALPLDHTPGHNYMARDELDLYTVSVIFGGALDEEFDFNSLYGVNIVDWMTEQVITEAAKQDGESWSIHLYKWREEGLDSDPSDIAYSTSWDKPNGN